MIDDNLLPFCFPAVRRKKITAAFDGGRISSDGGVMLLAQADHRLGIAERLARAIPDGRDPDRVTHLLPDILRARIFAIACGYEDADDLDRLRFDPAFKLACGRLPDSGRDLCSQPTVSRWENAPSLRDLIRLMGVMVDLYCASYTIPPAAVTLDIDDTVDVVHGHQQLSLFNAHYDERCFLPIHVYDTATSRPVAVLLRPGKTPSGTEIRGHLRRLVRRIRRHWPQTRITIRGDGHYGRPQVMEWCDENDIDFVVTSLETGSAEYLYETLYCARGQAENLIKLHKTQLASDRTSCRNPLANQMRLILHTAAYWLMLTVRDAIPKAHALATAEFNTIRLRLLKLGARVVEMASRVRLAFAAACPEAALIRHIAAALMPTEP